MIHGIGIDLIELERIKRSLAKGDHLAKRVLTPKELKIFHTYTSKKRKVEFLAGRFAAKEAFAKATGKGIGQISFQDIEILPDEKGAPQMTVKGYEAFQIFISLSHSDHYAVAQVLLQNR